MKGRGVTWVAGSATRGPVTCITAARIIDPNITRS